MFKFPTCVLIFIIHELQESILKIMLLAIMVTYESKDSFRGIKMYYKKIHHENTIYKHNKKSFSLAPYINFNLKCGIYIYMCNQNELVFKSNMIQILPLNI